MNATLDMLAQTCAEIEASGLDEYLHGGHLES
jgi:hypothetical protein